MAFVPRPTQQAVLTYKGGKMGISAVPGSGKTLILSYLAAQLVGQGLHEDQEVLVVTFANSAVDNLIKRITDFIRHEYALLPHVGYRVRTLHGLAHDIVRDRPGLAGLAEDFDILDERVTAQMRQDAVDAWLNEHPEALELFIAPDLDRRRLKWVRTKGWPDLVYNLAEKFISRAKDLQLSPAHLRLALAEALGDQPLERYPLLQLGLQVYEAYQRALIYRGGVDFDDLVRLALQVLQSDPQLLARLQYRWPYILEDEAQDSSELQERILRLLTENGHWVRVGDPNQAINTTFTTADPHFLRRFLREPGVRRCYLPNSGRSTRRIIELANYLVDWTCDAHPVPWLREGEQAAFLRQYIQPTGCGDPQPNPMDRTSYVVHLEPRPYPPDRELHDIVVSLARWLPAHPDWTVAVLVPINERGYKLAEMLRRRGLPCEELLRSTSHTRKTAGILETILRFLSNPLQPGYMAAAFACWHALDTANREGAPDGQHRTQLTRLLRRCPQPERFLYPRPGDDWLADIALGDGPSAPLLRFRQAARRWLQASILPADQLVLTLAQELFTEPSDLALAYKLALLMRQDAAQHPEKTLAERVTELHLIAHNQRRFLGFDEADLGYQPKPGVVTVTTMHKAKGLEWDRVYLAGVNNYNFPSAESHDYYRGESWFVRDQLNLEAEAIAQLELLYRGQLSAWIAGEATEKARVDYAAERLRLLYVGITRAKKELIITWNSGHEAFAPKQPATPFVALYNYWKERQ